MGIRVSQSELLAIGFDGDFPSLGFYDKARVAARALLNSGRERDAFLLEINNPSAIAGLTYVADAMKDFQRNMPGGVGI